MSIKLKVKAGGEEFTEDDVISVVSRYEVNGIPSLRLRVRDGNVATEKFAVADAGKIKIGDDVEVEVGFNTKKITAPIFKGIVTLVTLGVDTSPYFEVVARGKSILTTEQTVNAVQKKKLDDKKLIKDTLALTGYSGVKIPDSKIKHPQYIIFQQTPWQVMMQRMLVNGFVFVPGISEDKIESLAKLQAKAKELTFVSEQVVKFEVSFDGCSHIDDLKSAATNGNKQEVLKSPKGKEAKMYKAADIAGDLKRKAMVRAFPFPLVKEEVNAAANAEVRFRQLDTIRGVITIEMNADSKLGDIELLSALEFKSLGKRFAGEYLVTGVRHRISQGAWFVDFTVGLPLKRTLYAEEAKYRPLPLMVGYVAKFKENKDTPLCLPVVIPALHEKETCWSRLSVPAASKKAGFFFPPNEKDEVVIGFMGGHAAHPVILGCRHNDDMAPPVGWDKDMHKEQGMFLTLKKDYVVNLLSDKEAGEDYLQVKKGDDISLAVTAKEIALESGDEQTIELGEKTVLSGKNDLEIKAGKVAVKADKTVEIKATKTEVK